ncbi:TPA: hypothetical protein HA239_02315 [Candidatus Woesearchaeota archaeon]|nr:hypothetical protein QT06_C0001G1067 [archaeon GW2011_AR15]MBS3104462.1 hypothetical protein [Candidatus Woesearchaeota archaeon]HIH41224.1 hypothetical protein [Candidatus Woesearchaeota archaeon]
MAELVIIPAIVFGLVIGLVEMIFVHSDEIGMGWFMHGLHALPFTILFTFASMNVSWVLGFFGGIGETFLIDLGVRLAIAIIGMIKIGAAAAIAGRVGERFYHILIIGALLFASSYVWMFFGSFIPIPNWI